MPFKSPLIACLLVICTLATVGAVSVDKLHNKTVSVAELTLKPGEFETTASKVPVVMVYLQPGSFEVTLDGGQHEQVTVERGAVRYFQGKSSVIRNTGSSELQFARVEFLGGGGSETWGTAGLAPHYTLLIENWFARVYDIRIPGHTNEPQHTHKDRVVVCLSGASLMHRFPDGREEPSTLKTGEIAWRRGSTHIGQNLGETDFWAIAVEPK